MNMILLTCKKCNKLKKFSTLKVDRCQEEGVDLLCERCIRLIGSKRRNKKLRELAAQPSPFNNYYKSKTI